MQQNVSVCYCQRKELSYPTMMLNDQPLEIVQQYKYLGLLVSSSLSWTPHIRSICKKARRILDLISRNTDCFVTLRLYLALVRPHLEYAVQVWNPHLVMDKNRLEKVQKFALRVCAQNYSYTYEELLNCFEVPTLQNRRLFLSLCTFFNIVKEFVYFPTCLAIMPVASPLLEIISISTEFLLPTMIL